MTASDKQIGVPDRDRAPRSVRRAGIVVGGLLVAGAGYLIAVRGEALLVDLTNLAGGVWCF